MLWAKLESKVVIRRVVDQYWKGKATGFIHTPWIKKNSRTFPIQCYSKSNSTSQATLLSPLNITVVESAHRCSAEGTARGGFHLPCVPLPSIQICTESSYFYKLTCLAGAVYACSDLNAGVWIYVDSTWKLPLQISLLEVGLSQAQGGTSCFEGCDWPPFCEWQGEQIWLLFIPRGHIGRKGPSIGVRKTRSMLNKQFCIWLIYEK
jgi:hypothetical protein